MPPDATIKKVLILGSGPIVIGQAAEFDYAGTQACKAMREEGITSILVNSNPATIMTDEDIADVVYIEPLTVDVVERIIARERPDGLLPTLGGQTGLNLAKDLNDAGVLEKYKVRTLGTSIQAIQQAEDRKLFKNLMDDIGEPIPSSASATSLPEAWEIAGRLDFPLIIRPAYTLGGTGGGIARNEDEFEETVSSGLRFSPINQILVEEYLQGWKEIEYEVMRDAADNCITVCNMENLDPMGVHTGDSIVVAPSQTLSDKEYQMLRSAALKIIRALGIEGGCNIQYALDPKSFEYRVIEVNPRVSRSSALASKATGYPIARIAARIAIGRTLDEIANPITRETTAAFEPALDYIVVKIPRWPFDKFAGGDRTLGTQMKATGEVMAIERTMEAALNKAVRGLEFGGRTLLWEDPAWDTAADIAPFIDTPNDQRLWALMAALRRGITTEELARRTAIDVFFLEKLNNIYSMEIRLLEEPLDPSLLWEAKRLGFSDEMIGNLADELPQRVRDLRHSWGIRPVYKMVDTCAAEFAAYTPYYYSTYEMENEAAPFAEEAAVVIGSGPIRIGQGIEFDYCSVHSAWALQESGRKSVMINSNPETVSTDFDTSDRLYFEALDEESVADIIENETGQHAPAAVVQFGGQTAINLASPLYNLGIRIAGSDVKSIDETENREKFDALLERLGILRPPGAAVHRMEDALEVADRLGYPVLARPSYVLGGRAMEIVSDRESLKRYITTVTQPSPSQPVLIDKYLEGKEVEVDAICDGEDTLIPGIMEHIERAGVHSGDSFAVYPPIGLSSKSAEKLVEITQTICRAVNARGLVNIQYVVWEDEVYVIEVNPRASRTVPFMSKVTGVPMVRLATRIMLGQTLRDLGYEPGLWPESPLVAVKAPVFSMAKLSGVDTFLGPEMKSTGEVMGIDTEFAPALHKAMLSAGLGIPDTGAILMSIADRHKAECLPIAQAFADRGHSLLATSGTARYLRGFGLEVEEVSRLREGDNTMIDTIRQGRTVLVVNTLTGDRKTLQDGFHMRRAAAGSQVPCLTSIDTARALADAISAGGSTYNVLPLAAYRNRDPNDRPR
jgi:carbamoyl-phosphate synthase large subunit